MSFICKRSTEAQERAAMQERQAGAGWIKQAGETRV